jgi:hypothetical protein
VSLFTPTEWFVLGMVASIGVLACLRSLASEVSKETQVHHLKVCAAQLKIAHLREMRERDEPIGVDIIEDDDPAVEAVEAGAAMSAAA